MKTVKILKRLNNYLFAPYEEYDYKYMYDRSSACKVHNWEYSFKVGTTKYYTCRKCSMWKNVYLNRWFRI
jgi:hypothetical protein